jgi:glycyl-tRNA synthetase beta chain
MDFIKRRFIHDCSGQRGFDSGSVGAVVSVAFDEVNDCLKKIRAFDAIRKEQSFKVLAASYKRIRNIIKDNKEVVVAKDLFVEEAEKQLYSLFQKIRGKMEELINRQEYEKALKVMLEMKEPVDVFFDDVMVMAEDEAVRRNRLNLLTAIGDLILQIGDISKMQEN